MDINIGDKVRFLNAIGGGKVTGFQKGGLVLVEDEDGFEVPVLQSEVVVVASEGRSISDFMAKPEPKAVVQQPVVTNAVEVKAARTESAGDEDEESLEARVIRLEMTIRKLQRRIERLEDAKALREKIKQEKQEQRVPKDDTIEIDLHIEELLDTTAGMSAGDIKEYQLSVFRDVMKEHQKKKGQRIVFIHGNGDGVLRKAIISELRRSFPACSYQDASFQQYGFGATMVIV